MTSFAFLCGQRLGMSRLYMTPIELRLPLNVRRTSVISNENIIVAKKKGLGKKKGGQKKGSDGLASAVPRPKPYLSTPVIVQNLLMIESYFRKTGRPLFEEEVEISDVAEVLWNAPFAIVAHDTESKPEPTFVYGNQACLDLFESTWDELIGTPSSKSAAPDKEIQEERLSMLERAAHEGYVDDYEGWRTSFKGKTFKISKATIFNIESPTGNVVGQGAILPLWEYEDGRQGGPLAAITACPEAIKEAECNVERLALEVRTLKEEEGRTNTDEKVMDAVKRLLESKAALAALKPDVNK